MSFSVAVNRNGKPGLATWLSAKPIFLNRSVIDYGWITHFAASAWMGYHAFHGENPLGWIGLDAPAYKIGVVALAEGARAAFSLANVWEEEINYAASTLLVLVLLSMGGADVAKPAQQLLNNASASAAQIVQTIPDTRTGCTFFNPKLGRELTLAERHQCMELKSSGQMTKIWARNCGCSTAQQVGYN